MTKKAITSILATILLCINYYATAQYMSPEDEEKIGRLEELASNYYNGNNLPKAAQTFNLIAKSYMNYGYIPKAVTNFNNAAEIYIQLNKLEETRNTYTNIAVAYSEIDELELMCQYFEKSLEIRRKIGESNQLASGLIDLAFGLNAITHYDDAIKLLEEALKLSSEANNTSLVLECYKQLSNNYKQTGNLRLAQEMASKAETYAQNINKEATAREYETRVLKSESKSAVLKKENSELLAQQLESQLNALKLKLRQDSLDNELKAEQERFLEEERKTNDAKKEAERLALENKNKELVNAQLLAESQTFKIYIYIAIAVLIIISIFAIFLIRANRIRKLNNIKLAQQNDEIIKKGEELNDALKKIEHQNQSITQSINYAKGIQQALLRKQEALNDYIKDAFIFFKPRDIVSGDFYWFNEVCINPSKSLEEADLSEKRFIVTAVDCTGHGVPGAFMSMIGFNLLNVITANGTYHANEILEQLHIGVQNTLKQKETLNQDGMDMALCVIDPSTNTLEFSGAKNPLVYIQGEELYVIKGSNDGIGGKEDDIHFTNQTVTFDQPTWFYIFSDGYIDQFGGELGRKFMISNFKKYLLHIHNEPADKQCELLKQNILEWRGTKYNQLDDMMVIGFKLG